MTHFTEDEILKIPAKGVTRGSKVNSIPSIMSNGNGLSPLANEKIKHDLATASECLRIVNYPNQKRKEKAILKDAEEEFSWPNLINGYLQSIVYSLNKGREIKSNSAEHKRLKELLEKANEN